MGGVWVSFGEDDLVAARWEAPVGSAGWGSGRKMVASVKPIPNYR